MPKTKGKTKSFLTGLELDRNELITTLELAESLRARRGDPGDRARTALRDRHVALLFEKPSLRTRVSFTVAVQELGGSVIELNSGSKKKEEPEDTIRVLEGYVDACMVRTHEHASLERMASAARIPVINGLSDTHHPCQALADLLTLAQSFGAANGGGLRGLKIAYVGDGNNVLHSLLLLAPFLGVEVSFACPRGYEPSAFVVQRAHARARESGGKITAFSNPDQAVAGVNAVYTDVWTSMGFEQEETDRDRIFSAFQLNESLYEKASPNAIIMHCMPMIRGKEITDTMVEHPNSALFRQSENRLHVQKALLLRLFA